MEETRPAAVSYLAEATFAEDDEEIEVGGADEVLLGDAVDRP